jgi:hypothetical protein
VAALQRTDAQFLHGEELTLTSTQPILRLTESDAAADEGVWRMRVNGKVLTIETRTDAMGAGSPAIQVDRGTGTAVARVYAATWDGTGTTSGSFADFVRGGAWSALGWNTGTNTRLAVGGFRSSQWIATDLYANGASAGTFTDTDAILPGDLEIGGDTTQLGLVIKPGAASPTLCAGSACSTNNWNPTGLDAAYRVRLTCDAGGGNTCTITGLTGCTDGREVILFFVAGTGTTVALTNQDSNSSESNRFVTGTGGTLNLTVDQSVLLHCLTFADNTRWRVIGRNF